MNSKYLLIAGCLLITRAAETQQLLPFQGRLFDQADSRLSGTNIIRFQLFGEASGGEPLWKGEDHRATVNDGLVSVILGSQNRFPSTRPNNPAQPLFASTTYLEITPDVNDDGLITTNDPPLRPRQVLLPAVFAAESANSYKLNGFDWRALFGAEGTNAMTGMISGGRIAPQSIEALQLGVTLSNQLSALFTWLTEREWTRFSTNIYDIVKGDEDYHARWEFGVFRNSGFRKLHFSHRNGEKGTMVMTEPYMTGDYLDGGTGTGFRLGGSMWIWDTLDMKDDEGVWHLYYFYDNGMVHSSEGRGNGLGADVGKEGWFWRRRRQ